MLLGTNEVCIAEDLVTLDEQAELAAWAEAQRKAGRLVANPADPGGFMTPYVSADGKLTRMTGGTGEDDPARQMVVFVPPVAAGDELEFPESFWRVRDRILGLMEWGNLREDPYKGSFLSITSPGGSVHRHVDAQIDCGGEMVDILRCNVLFRRPQGGGLPVIGPRLLEVPDRGMWSFYPTALRHSATAVEGPWDRGTLSFGFAVSRDERADRRFEIASSTLVELGLKEQADRTRFADMLGRSSIASALGARLGLVDLAIRTAGPFSVREAAVSCFDGSVEQAEKELVDLQRKGFVESLSSRRPTFGSVLVL